MDSLEKPTLLTIGIPELPWRSQSINRYTAASVREAVAIIRLITFDLLLVGLNDPRLNVWDLMRRVTAAWPQQRWILASQNITPQQEILGRSLGALMILDECPDELWLRDFLASLSERDRLRRLVPLDSVNGSTVDYSSVIAKKAS